MKNEAQKGLCVVLELHRDGRGITAVCYCNYESADPTFIRSRMFKTRKGAEAYARRFLGDVLRRIAA